MYILNINELNMEPCGTPLKISSKTCKSHLPLFFVSFFQGNMLRCIENLYPPHINLVLQLTIDDRYNLKPWRGLLEERYHSQRYQDICFISQSYVLNIVLR